MTLIGYLLRAFSPYPSALSMAPPGSLRPRVGREVGRHSQSRAEAATPEHTPNPQPTPQPPTPSPHQPLQLLICRLQACGNRLLCVVEKCDEQIASGCRGGWTGLVPACGESHSRARKKPGQSSLRNVQAAAASGDHSLCLLPRPWILGKGALGPGLGLSGWVVRLFPDLSFLICSTWTSEVSIALMTL